ncbi:MBL fold metallo-hydrolase [Desulfosarcina sp. OttesenSCG-928-A07]|nr:MBL fold metallo-hydrolase [Desulfosarcina sp. OttesenSCG-928-A07]
MNRLLFHFVTLGIAGFLTLCSFAGTGSAAAAEAAGTLKFVTVGNAGVWAIADSTSPMNMLIFPDAGPETASRYAPSGKVPSAVMAFVVHQQGEWILIDTGLGGASLYTDTGMMAGLKAAGIKPERITKVLLTHMHRDHIGGLIQGGTRTFPNARIRLSRPEFEFWRNSESVKQFPHAIANFELAQRVLAIYADAVDVFDFDTVVAPGIRALDASGHTPGHTAFLLESNGQKLFFVGDIINGAAIQFPRPDINSVYDMNPAAAATRMRLLEQAVRENLPIAGAHLPFPAIFWVKSDGAGMGGFQCLDRLNAKSFR